MNYHLSDKAVACYEDDGYLSPVDVLSPAEAAEARSRLERFEQAAGDAAGGMRTDLHLLERWAWDLVHHPRIVEPVVSLLGDDVLLWSMNWFIKEPGDAKFVSLHQDASYWGLEPHDVLTVWLALSDAAAATGPMHFLPGSHRGALYEHEDTYDAGNLLTRGQTISAVDEQACRLAPLTAGQMSLHHVRIVHGSGPNATDDRRIGMVLRYCATHVRQVKGDDTAVLVTGQDRYGHFELLSGPAQDNGPAERARHQAAVQKLTRIVMMD